MSPVIPGSSDFEIDPMMLLRVVMCRYWTGEQTSGDEEGRDPDTEEKTKEYHSPQVKTNDHDEVLSSNKILITCQKVIML